MNDFAHVELLFKMVDELVEGSSAVTEFEADIVGVGAMRAASWIAEYWEPISVPVAQGVLAEIAAAMESAVLFGFAEFIADIEPDPGKVQDAWREFYREGFFSLLLAYPNCGFVLTTREDHA
jgi:hypothetical protein